MVRVLALLLSATCMTAFGGNVQWLTSLPNAAVSKAIQLDATGNIYLAGSVTPQNPQSSQDTSDAFVAKVSADGSTLLYYTVLSGSSTDAAAAIAVGSDGSAYVAGSTGSSDFPVTAGALQTTFNTAGASQGFLVKVSPAGAVAYSTYISGPVYTQATGVAIDNAGEVFVTGLGGPAYPGASGQPVQGFVLKVNAGLSSVLMSIYGYGGGLISLDSQGNIYLAGNAAPDLTAGPNGPIFTLPALPAGAFQSTHTAELCSEASGPGGGFATLCPYQIVAKLDATGKLLWATYVTGTYGAQATGMAVDGAGNVIVAGTTNSNDYPVTEGAFQTAYPAAAPQSPSQSSPFNSYTGPPDSTGYVTKVNSTGTGLVWSTYFGGSFEDQITGMAVSPTGEIIISGRAGSSDLPVLSGVPDGCRPSANQVLGFVASLAPDGASAGAAQLVQGAPDCLYLSCSSLATYQGGWPLALRADGTVVTAGSSGALASIDLSANSRVACMTDPADNAQLSTVAPGQLISLFGADLAPAAPYTPAGGVAESSNTFGVFFNGIPAPILYSSGQQINVQVPFEIAGASAVQMQVVSQQIANPLSETRTLAVVERQPAIFLSQAAISSPFPGWSTCGGTFALGQAALALNADGTVNDCTNPAAAGSAVTVFLSGSGPATPALGTGVIAQGPAAALAPSLNPGPFTGTTVIATADLPGSITGVAQVQLRAGGGAGQDVLLNGPTLSGTPLRERVILIWTR